MSCQIFLSILAITLPFAVTAQKEDTAVHIHKGVNVSGFKTVCGTGHKPEVKNGIIYTGKKSEITVVVSLDANKAINNTRQI